MHLGLIRLLAGAALLLGTTAGTLAAAAGRGETRPLAVEVRVFEVRRVNSDFSPVEDLSFLVNSDGTAVQVSEWLATLARRIPDSYFAQLLTLGPAPVTPEAQWAIRRQDGRRGIRLRVRPAPEEAPTTQPTPDAGAAEPAPRFRLDFDLLRSETPVQEIDVQGTIEPGMTRMVSGRDFEVSLSRYLSWFREPADLAAREELYESIRNQNIYLAVGITFRHLEEAAPALPVRLRPPHDPQLRQLRSPLIGNAAGALRLRVLLDETGAVAHTEVLETTLPEVTPRVLGIVRAWQFPQAAGRQIRLSIPVRSVRLIPSG